MDLLKSELGSSDETRVTSTNVCDELTGIKARKVSDISEVVNQETTTTPAVKTEPNLSCVPVVQTALASLSYKRRKDICSETSVMACETVSVNYLPNEILLKIFSHFGPEDLCLIIAKVCEKWNFLAKGMILWKMFCYDCDRSSDINRIKQVLTNVPSLHSLIVRRREDVADILKFFNHIHGDLRKLILEICCLGDDGTLFLENIVDLYPALEVLTLQSCYPLTNAGYSLIPRLTKLSELNLLDCWDLSGSTVRLIADSCQHLKKLNLDGAREVDDGGVIHVIDRLGRQLTTLVLDGSILTDDVFLHLKNCSRLKELEVSWCHNMRDRGLLEGIGSLHELTSLRLYGGYNLTAEALSVFLHRTSMSSITSLKLSSFLNLDDEGVKGIAERCIHLKELAVCEQCNVTDDGISMVVRHCNELRVLNLEGLENITGNGWLALVPSYLPGLSQLSLENCENMCEEYVEELMAAEPELEVIMYVD